MAAGETLQGRETLPEHPCDGPFPTDLTV